MTYKLTAEWENDGQNSISINVECDEVTTDAIKHALMMASREIIDQAAYDEAMDEKV